MAYQVTDEHRNIWLRALIEEFGLKLVCSEQQLTLNDLYETRKQMADPRLEEFRIISLKDALFIVRKETDIVEIEKEIGNAPSLS